MATAGQLASTPLRVPPALLAPACVESLLWSAAQEWALALLLWAAILLTPLWSYPLWALLLAGRYHAMGVILHDACHNAPRDRGLRWTLLELLGGYPLGTSIDAMRHHHLRHHRNVNMAGDPYFRAVEGRPLLSVLFGLAFGGLPLFWLARSPLGVAAYHLPRLRNLYGWFLLDTSGDRAHDRELILCARRDHGLFLSLLLLGFASWQAPSILALCYWVPLVLTGWAIGIRFLAEHRYVRAGNREPETLMSHTRNHCTRAPLSWVLAPRNGGYHLVHHLHPRAAYHRLPLLHRWYAEHHPGYAGSAGS
jgi:fatty acid desaturase